MEKNIIIDQRRVLNLTTIRTSQDSYTLTHIHATVDYPS